MLVDQVKSNPIRQREVDLLVPAAGAGANVLHLLRPAGVLPGQQGLSTLTSPVLQLQSAEKEKATQSSKPEASAVFRAKTTPGERLFTEVLLGISCAIGTGGEVCFLNLKGLWPKEWSCESDVILYRCFTWSTALRA